MDNKIFVNGKLWASEYKKGRNVFVILEDNTVISKGLIKEIQIECHECHCLKTVNFYGGLLKRKYICQSCRNKGERNSFYGRKHSQEVKDKLSKERKGVWGVGKNNSMYGKKCTDYMTPEQIEQWKQNISKATKGEKNPMYGRTVESIVGSQRWKEIKEKGHQTQLNFSAKKKKQISKKLSLAQKQFQQKDPQLYKELKAKGGRAACSKRTYYKMNKFEQKIDMWLTEHNIDHIYSVIMQNDDKRNFQFDFLIKDKRILIECNGTYWHADPRFFGENIESGKRLVNDIQRQKIKLDEDKKKFAKKHNFTLIVVWEYDINNNNWERLEKGVLTK